MNGDLDQGLLVEHPVVGDAFLLCSDRLSGYVAEPEIEKVLHGPATVQQVPERLMELALAAGGEDNITVQFIQYGRRTEVQAASKTTKELPVMKVDSPRLSYLQTAIFLFFLAGVCGGIFFYFENKLLGADHLSAQLQKFQARDNELQNQLDEFKRELGAITRKQAETESDKVEHKSGLKKLHEKLDQLQAELEKAKSQVQALQSKAGRVETKLKKAKDQEKKLPTQLEVEKKKTAVPAADPPETK